MSQNQDEARRYVVWIGPNDEITLSAVNFGTEIEAEAYIRGVIDANGWERGTGFNSVKAASLFIDELHATDIKRREEQVKKHVNSD